MKVQNRKSFVFLLICLASLIMVLAVIIYIKHPQWSRERNDIYAAYANSHFTDVDNFLKLQGIVLHPESSGMEYVCTEYRTSHSTNTVCAKTVMLFSYPVDGTFIKQWSDIAPSLQRYIVQHGWQPYQNNETPAARLIDLLGINREKYGPGLMFTKQQGAATCAITFSYMLPESSDDQQLHILQSCYD